MAQLMMKKKYWDLVKRGVKTVTIRKRTRLKPGDDVLVHSGGKIVGRIRVKNVYERELDEIGEEEAQKEGIPLNKLKKELKRLYGRGKLYVIEFRLVEVFDPPIDPEDRAYGKYTPRELAHIALEKKLYSSEEERKILERVARTGSIRKVAMSMGGLGKRKKIRRVLRKAYERLTSS